MLSSSFPFFFFFFFLLIVRHLLFYTNQQERLYLSRRLALATTTPLLFSRGTRCFVCSLVPLSSIGEYSHAQTTCVAVEIASETLCYVLPMSGSHKKTQGHGKQCIQIANSKIKQKTLPGVRGSTAVYCLHVLFFVWKSDQQSPKRPKLRVCRTVRHR